MNRIAIAVLIAQATCFSSGVFAAGSMTSDPRLESAGTGLSLDDLMNPTSQASTGVNSLRAQLLADGGRTVGFRGGLAARAQDLITALRLRERALDVQYEFGSLISPSGVLPPVIVESRDVASFSPDQIRTANRVFKKERPERFVSVPPTWRDYLLVGLPTQANVDLPVMEARPVDSAEMKVWQEAVKQGWQEGADQAMAILEANFNRLTRDYKGMVLYSTLLQQELVTRSQVSESQQTVTGDGGQLTLGDKLRRLVGKAEFQVDASKWRPTIKVGPVPAPPPEAVPVTTAAVSTPAPAIPKIVVANEPQKTSAASTAVPAPSASAPMQPKPAQGSFKVVTVSKPLAEVTQSAAPAGKPVAATAPVATAAIPELQAGYVPLPPKPVTTAPAPAPAPAVAPAPVSAPAKPVVPPAPIKPVTSTWEAKDGSTLRKTLEQWAAKAGWTVEWEPEDLNYELPHLSIDGTFEDAVIKLFSYFQNAERPLVPKGSRLQKHIRITEKTK